MAHLRKPTMKQLEHLILVHIFFYIFWNGKTHSVELNYMLSLFDSTHLKMYDEFHVT